MAQSNLCLVLLFSAFTTASAPQPLTSDLECSEVDRLSMLDECKISRCRVKELCHDKRLGIWSYRHRNFITCESLECLNGGTPILPYQVKNFLFCCQRCIDVLMFIAAGQSQDQNATYRLRSGATVLSVSNRILRTLL